MLLLQPQGHGFWRFRHLNGQALPSKAFSLWMAQADLLLGRPVAGGDPPALCIPDAPKVEGDVLHGDPEMA